MIVRLVKGGRIYSFTFCINVNETLEKDTEILKIDKIGENEPSSTITEKKERLKTCSSYFQKRNWNWNTRQKQNSKWKNKSRYETWDRNLKNEKQVQSNLIKLKKKEIYEKNQTIEQYEKENSNHKLAIKKQEAVIRATTERGNKLQNELDQTKNKMTIQ